MSDFIEILGENKANLNKDLRVRLILEEPKRMLDETTLFQNINQEAQFYAEKLASNTFRIYGSVAPSLNLNLKGGEKPNYNLFKFQEDNWQVVLLKPTRFFDGIGKKNFIKENIHEYDFNYGLPCLKVIPAQDEYKNYMAFNLYNGHNFKVDDRVYITSLDPEYLASDYYNVIGVDGQVVYIDMEYVEVIPDWDESEFTTEVTIDEQAAQIEADKEALQVVPKLTAPNITAENTFVEVDTKIEKKGWWLWRRKKVIVTEIRSKYMGAVNLVNAAPDPADAANNAELLRLRNVEFGLLTPSVLLELKNKRPNIAKLIKPKFFMQKVQEDYHLEYYMKQAEVVAVVNQLDDCAFSLSATGEAVKNFTFPDIDITNMVDNLGVPVTELVLGIIKRPGNTEREVSDVEAHFSKLIDYTDLGHGLETVMEKQVGSEIDSLKVGDKLFIGLYEYDKEELQEVKVADIYHRAIHKDVAFAYNPFYPIKLKSFASYVEDSDTKSFVPSYATYSDIKQKYIWRDILDIGFFEEEGVGVDHPFLNGAFYIYKPLVFNLRNDFSVKYKYNQNDINGSGDDLEIESMRDILNDLLVDVNDNRDQNKGFQEFKSKKC